MPAARSYRQRNSHGKTLGRFTLAGLFVVFCVARVLLYATLPAIKDPNSLRSLIGTTVVTTVWTIVLFTFMWMGNNVARYICLAMTAAGICLAVPDILESVTLGVSLPFGLWFLMLYNIASFFILLYSPYIRALTKRY